MKVVIVKMVLLISLVANAQIGFRKQNICAFNDTPNVTDAVMQSFEKTQEDNKSFYMRSLLDKILKKENIPGNFIIFSSAAVPKSNIAIAYMQKGIRYIVYNYDIFSQLDDTVTDWASVLILSHEIGHHFLGHSDMSIDEITIRQKELDADTYAGKLLFELGASLQQADDVIKHIPEPLSTFCPSRAERQAAIAKGYTDAGKGIPLAAKKEATPTVHRLYCEAWRLMEKNQTGKALEMIPKIMKLNDKFDDCYVLQGNLYINQKRYNEALGAFDKAITLNKYCESAYTGKAQCCIILKKYKDAADLCNKVLEFKPRYSYAMNLLGDVAVSNGDYTLAIQRFGKAIEYNPTVAAFYYNRGICYFNTESFEAAISDFTKALAKKPNYNEALLQRGYAKAYLGIEAYMKTMTQNDVTSNRKLSRFVSKPMPISGALADMVKAFKNAPDDINVIIGYAWAKAINGDEKEALELLEKAKLRYPKNPDVYFALAQVYSKRNNTRKICENLDKSCQLGNSGACYLWGTTCH